MERAFNSNNTRNQKHNTAHLMGKIDRIQTHYTHHINIRYSNEKDLVVDVNLRISIYDYALFTNIKGIASEIIRIFKYATRFILAFASCNYFSLLYKFSFLGTSIFY